MSVKARRFLSGDRSASWAAVEAMAAVATRMREDGDLSGLRGGGQVAEWLGS